MHNRRLLWVLLFLFVLGSFSADALVHPLRAKPLNVTIKNGDVFILKGDGLLRYNKDGQFVSNINNKVTHLKIDLKNKIAYQQSVKIRNGEAFISNHKLSDKDILKYARYFDVKPELEKLVQKIFYPEQITVGPDGMIYAIGKNYFRSRGYIGVIDPKDGHTIATYRIMSVEEAKDLYPRGIAVDNDGDIYVTNFEDYPIKKFTKDGKFIKGIGKRGKGKGEFIWPWGIAVDKRNGDVYATDVYAPRAKEFEKSNLCVQKFNNDGKFLKRWGGELVKVNSWFPPKLTFLGDNTIEFAEGIAVDSKGYVYVLEKFGPRVSKFNSNGSLVKRWGKKGTAPGEFNAPEAICVDKDGNVYVADTGNNRVQKFDPNGRFLMEIK